jgi:hypothetical protein
MNNEDQIIESLILNGGLEVAGIDIETGEALYNFTDKLEHVSPELHKVAKNYFHLEMMNLWEKGFLDITLESENPTVSITDKALDSESVNKLDKGEKQSLDQVIRITKQEK